MPRDDYLYRILLGIKPHPTYTPLSKLLGMDSPPPPANFTMISALLGRTAPSDPVPAAIPPAPKWDGIWFDRTNGPKVRFSEPVRFDWAFLPSAPGLYVILAPDTLWGPRTFRPIYFGQAGVISNRATLSHEKFNDWVHAAGGSNQLYVSYATMWSSSENARIAVESGLIGRYSPPCNETFNPFRGLFGSR